MLEAANLTSTFDPNLDPNRPQQRPTQADTPRRGSPEIPVGQGVPLHTVSRMLGHPDPAMTLRRFAHVLGDMSEDAARAMDELF